MSDTTPTVDTREPVFCMTLAEAMEASSKGFRPYHWKGPDPYPAPEPAEDDD